MAEELNFFKMQATGNDFVLIDNRHGLIRPDQQSWLAQRMSDRKFGVGSDGLILLEEEPKGDGLIMHYKNPDGSDAGMCGNGARCFVRFARLLGYGNPTPFRVHNKYYTGEEGPDGIIIRFPLETRAEELSLDGIDLLRVYTNTEHIVCEVSSDRLRDESRLREDGRALRRHKAFAPAGTNVNFIRGVDKNRVELQTYERGVEDLTLACGTGAIAAALAWHHRRGSEEGHFSTTVNTRGGDLRIHFDFDREEGLFRNIRLEGRAESVFEGTYYLQENAIG